MLQLVSQASSLQPRAETIDFSERLDDFAREMEGAGLPWAAARIRDVMNMIAAEQTLAEAFRS
jgi:hypothetical protein